MINSFIHIKTDLYFLKTAKANNATSNYLGIPKKYMNKEFLAIELETDIFKEIKQIDNKYIINIPLNNVYNKVVKKNGGTGALFLPKNTFNKEFLIIPNF